MCVCVCVMHRLRPKITYSIMHLHLYKSYSLPPPLLVNDLEVLGVKSHCHHIGVNQVGVNQVLLGVW